VLGLVRRGSGSELRRPGLSVCSMSRAYITTSFPIAWYANKASPAFVSTVSVREYADDRRPLLRNMASLVPKALLRQPWQFVYNYPLRGVFEHPLPTSSVGEVFRVAARDYQFMYSTTTPLPHDGSIVMNARYPQDPVLNPYGIDLHELDDLFFEGFELSIQQRQIKFIVGS
jgi:hypothetical protein